MIDALISREEFNVAIAKLEKRIATNLIYVRGHSSVIVAPLYHLADAEAKAKRMKRSNPELAKHLRELTREWASIIAQAAADHPRWREMYTGISKALNGEHPKTRPQWIKHFYTTTITGDDDTVHVPTYSALVAKPEEGGRWGASSEPAGDLYKVLDALGYPPRLKDLPGVKPKGGRKPKT
ncbi:hypothetical protein HZ994_02095 [Akkermansiaceae bacterium]|nr:hypothetical protein HZ994_02095 [Akkermansiaceae bacterium]